jgi:hypothetical protein
MAKGSLFDLKTQFAFYGSYHSNTMYVYHKNIPEILAPRPTRPNETFRVPKFPHRRSSALCPRYFRNSHLYLSLNIQ